MMQYAWVHQTVSIVIFKKLANYSVVYKKIKKNRDNSNQIKGTGVVHNHLLQLKVPNFCICDHAGLQKQGMWVHKI